MGSFGLQLLGAKAGAQTETPSNKIQAASCVGRLVSGISIIIIQPAGGVALIAVGQDGILRGD